MKKNNKVYVSDDILVGAGKSSRLAAISNKVISNKSNSGLDHSNKLCQFDSGLKPETKIVFAQAINLIDEKILVVLNGFPVAKKNSLFKLRFGVGIDNLNNISIKQIFSLLHLDVDKVRYFKLIENLDTKGMLVVDHDK